MRSELMAAIGLGGLGAGGALALLFPMEAGIPVPVPADLVMLLVGQQAAAGTVPLWVALVVMELATVTGITALFLAVRGPGRGVLLRVGSRLGLTEARLARVTRVLERRGPVALALGRCTPGLRTATVLAAGISGIPAGRALAALFLGGTVFVQGHVLLGFGLGSLAEEFLDNVTGPFLIGVAALAGLGLILWFVRRGRRRGAQSWAEASCPACLALAAAFEREPEAPVVAGPTAT